MENKYSAWLLYYYISNNYDDNNNFTLTDKKPDSTIKITKRIITYPVYYINTHMGQEFMFIIKQ